jgi:SAM-dependent methyltransferase
VVNVGAGTGSYEPPATVLAVEPSEAMISQRPSGSAPAVRATAESIPLADGACDAALAVLTIHHLRDPERGVREMRPARPQAYLDPAVRPGASNLAQLGPPVDRAVAALRDDLHAGVWHERNHALLDLDELDLGYRLLTSRTR